MAGTVVKTGPGGGKLFRRRPGVRYGGRYLRGNLCGESGGLAESPRGSI
jgi:hypothetical protein